LPDEKTLSSDPPDSTRPIPISWKVGSWICSIVVAMAFLAGLFRVDGMPFYSWCLYNHHPTDVVLAKPFVQSTIEYAAHKCLTTPAINPACGHLGNYRVGAHSVVLLLCVSKDMILTSFHNCTDSSTTTISRILYEDVRGRLLLLQIEMTLLAPLESTRTGNGCFVARTFSPILNLWSLKTDWIGLS
jgi:hypothetical protein